eukprot:TRINITY_DN13551_c0_g1_i1.p1 TRINITY_DN13551_c0_g1~~TRINITY_DN13551_c0_g1_i1.p1  ORF type:complete len:342 (-),score=73.32 TRINITY_DN13551_c0_g1_i1:991-2016(-)
MCIRDSINAEYGAGVEHMADPTAVMIQLEPEEPASPKSPSARVLKSVLKSGRGSGGVEEADRSPVTPRRQAANDHVSTEAYTEPVVFNVEAVDPDEQDIEPTSPSSPSARALKSMLQVEDVASVLEQRKAAGIRHSNWKDVNMPVVCSDLESLVSGSRDAAVWDGAGEEPGLKVWRIEVGKVVAWPEEQYGQFYKGDSYIILHSRADSEGGEGLLHDIYNWIGGQSTQIEYVTASLKAAELDVHLGNTAVWHREAQGGETVAFKMLFGDQIKLLTGGVEDSVEEQPPSEPIMYHIKGTKSEMSVTQVPIERSCMNSGDVFLLDDPKSDSLFLWQGCRSRDC